MTFQSTVVGERCHFTAEFPVQKPLSQLFGVKKILKGDNIKKEYLTRHDFSSSSYC